MNRFDLFQELLNSVWYLSERSQAAYRKLATEVLKGGLLFNDAKTEIEKRNGKPQIEYYSATLQNINFLGNSFEDGQIEDSELIAELNLSGVMLKNDGISSTGTETLRKNIAIVGQSKASALRLKVDSGGGSAMSCEQLCIELSQFEQRYNKPVIAYIDGQCCSAAYYAVSNMPFIAIAGKGNEVGSIGTLCTLYNDSELMEREGIKEIIVRATKSTNKNEAFYQALQGNTEILQREILDPLQASFEQYVRQGRKKIKANSEALTGKTYFGDNSIEMGLVDSRMDNFESLDYLMRTSRKKKRK